MQVGRRVVQRSRRHVSVHLSDKRLAVVGVVGRHAVQCRRAAQAVCAVGVGGRAAAISARDQAVLAVPGVRSAPTRQGVAVGVVGVSGRARARGRQQAVGSVVSVARRAGAAVRLLKPVAHRVERVAVPRRRAGRVPLRLAVAVVDRTQAVQLIVGAIVEYEMRTAIACYSLPDNERLLQRQYPK